MTQDQWNIVKRIDEKCGKRILECIPMVVELGKDDFANLSGVDEAAIAWRLMVEMARFGKPPHCTPILFTGNEMLNEWFAHSTCDECAGVESIEGYSVGERGSPFAAVLALSERVLL